MTSQWNIQNHLNLTVFAVLRLRQITGNLFTERTATTTSRVSSRTNHSGWPLEFWLKKKTVEFPHPIAYALLCLDATTRPERAVPRWSRFYEFLLLLPRKSKNMRDARVPAAARALRCARLPLGCLPPPAYLLARPAGSPASRPPRKRTHTGPYVSSRSPVLYRLSLAHRLTYEWVPSLFSIVSSSPRSCANESSICVRLHNTSQRSQSVLCTSDIWDLDLNKYYFKWYF